MRKELKNWKLQGIRERNENGVKHDGYYYGGDDNRQYYCDILNEYYDTDKYTIYSLHVKDLLEFDWYGKCSGWREAEEFREILSIVQKEKNENEDEDED